METTDKNGQQKNNTISKQRSGGRMDIGRTSKDGAEQRKTEQAFCQIHGKIEL